METELAQLTSSGATVVVKLMALDRWAVDKARVVDLLCHGRLPGEVDDLEGELEQERGEVTAALRRADPAVITDLEMVWRSRLGRLLRETPSAAILLRELVRDSP
ncbi:hypothetical protein [Streptomyces sp. NPDC008317]|uniref:hypothetical protein n=1 Tax=Streptomyces sp. NPDC008317 TaxID=3364827 RepID=UPI0036E5AF95